MALYPTSIEVGSPNRPLGITFRPLIRVPAPARGEEFDAIVDHNLTADDPAHSTFKSFTAAFAAVSPTNGSMRIFFRTSGYQGTETVAVPAGVTLLYVKGRTERYPRPGDTYTHMQMHQAGSGTVALTWTNASASLLSVVFDGVAVEKMTCTWSSNGTRTVLDLCSFASDGGNTAGGFAIASGALWASRCHFHSLTCNSGTTQIGSIDHCSIKLAIGGSWSAFEDNAIIDGNQMTGTFTFSVTVNNAGRGGITFTNNRGRTLTASTDDIGIAAGAVNRLIASNNMCRGTLTITGTIVSSGVVFPPVASANATITGNAAGVLTISVVGGDSLMTNDDDSFITCSGNTSYGDCSVTLRAGSVACTGNAFYGQAPLAANRRIQCQGVIAVAFVGNTVECEHATPGATDRWAVDISGLAAATCRANVTGNVVVYGRTRDASENSDVDAFMYGFRFASLHRLIYAHNVVRAGTERVIASVTQVQELNNIFDTTLA